MIFVEHVTMQTESKSYKVPVTNANQDCSEVTIEKKDYVFFPQTKEHKSKPWGPNYSVTCFFSQNFIYEATR